MTIFYLSALLLVVHAAVLVRWTRGWRMATSPIPSPNRGMGAPSFTVVIPARNEAHTLPSLLDDLAAQSPVLPFSVVVIDDGSEDGTANAAQNHPLARDARLRVVKSDGAGKKSALLTGLQNVTTPWAVTLDADVRMGQGWAESWKRALSHSHRDVTCVAGPVVLLTRDETSPSLFARLQALDFAAQMGWSAGQLARKEAGSASGANLAVRPETYPDTRGLSASGDDTLVVQALQSRGHTVQWLSDGAARVWAPGASSAHEWVSQRLRWAGKTKHYPWAAKRTAAWMGLMAATQGMLVAEAAMAWGGVSWAWAAGWWGGVTALNVMYARPVAQWFGVKAGVVDWVVLGLTQPLQVPVLLLAKAGVLRPLGIASRPTWKGRTCNP
ncbi:MAG: glycosyltransferase [Flavobacteriales bacterium]|nr:glycosyltransferase [Flavobacteriales bacterium]